MHIFDGWVASSKEKPWKPINPHNKDPSQLDASCSIISKDFMVKGAKIPVYTGLELDGIIFRPGVTRVNCGKGKDSGGHCLHASSHESWCIPSGQDIDLPGDGCGMLPWKPSDIGQFLEYTAGWTQLNQRTVYNEIIVNGSVWHDQLPMTIEAFFTSAGSKSGTAHTAAKTFRAQYPLHSAPLVRFDVGDWNHPFKDM